MKAMARRPEDRYPTAGALAAELRQYLSSPGKGQGRRGPFWK
jgi:hypothetical protein